MKQNIKIVVFAMMVVAMVFCACSKANITDKQQNKIVRFPEVTLNKNERITQVEMSFQTTHIKGIRNIPIGWDIDIVLDPPPNPKIRGSIIVGAAALDSAKELPEFEIENYITEIEPKAIEAVFMVSEFPGDLEKERKIEIKLN